MDARVIDRATNQDCGSTFLLLGMGMSPMEAVAGKRKDKSALHLSRYVVDASRNAAMSRGDLDEAQNVRHVAAVRSHLWPERQDCPMEQMAVNIAILNT